MLYGDHQPWFDIQKGSNVIHGNIAAIYVASDLFWIDQFNEEGMVIA